MIAPNDQAAFTNTGCDACRDDLADVLASGSLVATFRPVADMRDGSIFGHLASAHAPAGHLFTFRRLFAVARRLERLPETLSAYFGTAARQFVLAQGQGRLLLPLPAGSAEQLGDDCARLLAEALADAGLPLERAIAIHPGVADCGDKAGNGALAAAAGLRRLGCGLAADSYFCPRSDALLWSVVAPDYALVYEETFTAAGAQADHPGRHAQAVAELAALGRRIIGVNVTTPETLKAMGRLDIHLAAGDFIGRPFTIPTRTLSAAAHRLIVEARGDGAGTGHGTGHVLEKMLMSIPAMAPDTPSAKVFSLFERESELRAVAVARDGVPVGLIARYDMVDNMARPYRQELYGRKPCTRFMDPDPLVVDVRLPLHELANVVVNAHPRHLISGFIITDGGRYLGMGSVQDLVREVTAMQMEAAKYANPLTQLPGNVPINQHIDNLLAAREPCDIAYCDLDHFKPFNDVYGYARGDEVIRLTARILAEACDPETDFVGHIGGDDFVLVFRRGDWRRRCEDALRLFGEEILGYFSLDDIAAGGYVTENRKGQKEFHRLTALSIGVTDAPPGMFRNHLEVAAVAAEVKRKAKAMAGNSLYVNQRIYEPRPDG